jgi:hypothetical protein
VKTLSKRRLCRLASATLLALVAVGSATQAATPNIAGTRCSKAGVIRNVKSVTFVCIGAGKTLKWKQSAGGGSSKGSTNSTTATTTAPTTTTTVARPSAAATVAAKINTFVAPMRTRNQPIPTIEYRFGPSVGEADRAMTRLLAESFFKYGSFPQLANYRNAISVSLSNAETIETTAPWMDVSSWGNIAGGYSGTGTYALVIQNFTAHRCGVGTTPADCAARDNGGALGNFKTRVNVLHELSHGGKVAVMGVNPSLTNSALDRLPMWLASGISNIQGAMLLAVIDNTSYSNLNISVAQAMRCRNVPISANSINDVNGGEGWGCKGIGTGDFANEILVARFGLDKVISVIAEMGSNPVKSTWPDWSSVWAATFQRAFLQSPSSFERDVETYRAAVINGTDLPADFLDAKVRP